MKMENVILSPAMSLDGFINDRHGSAAALYADLDTLRDTQALSKSMLGEPTRDFGF